MNVTNTSTNKLIVALDVETAQRALQLVSLLRDHVGMFKIGSQLFTAEGPDLVRQIVHSGNRVFLDLKFHDIPNTVAAAAVEATRLGVSILNVHASGGAEMMQRTAELVTKTSTREGLVRPAVIAVTVLTSSNTMTLRNIGIDADPLAQVQRLAQLAARCGMDGVVASPLEVAAIRGAVVRQDFLIVTPGVRPANRAADDQKRVMTPAEATKAGADFLVIGRPIIAAVDPVAAAQAITSDINSAVTSAAPHR
jgi:orotidine-5'-phosphate decarboxylase